MMPRPTVSSRAALVWLCLGTAIADLDRVNLSQTIIPMSKELTLSPLAQGIVLSAFAWGYVLMMVPAGNVVDRMGPRRVLTWAAIGWSFATATTGLFRWPAAILASRFAVGAFEAPYFPASAHIVRRDVPIEKRGMATAVFDVGSYIGLAVAPLLVVQVILVSGWRTAFWVSAGLGVLWAVAARRNVGTASTASVRAAESQLAPDRRRLLRLAVQRPIAFSAVGFFGYNCVKSFFLTWLPTFLLAQVGFGFRDLRLAAAIPALAAIPAELGAGFLVDALLKRGSGVTTSRLVPLCIGLALAGTLVVSTVAANRVVALAFTTIAFAGLIAASPSIWTIPGDLAASPNEVGTIGGLQNSLANCAGIVAPIVTGWLYGTTGTFTAPMLVCGGAACLGVLAYAVGVRRLRAVEVC